MPRLTLLSIGKIKDSSLSQLYSHYQKRLSHYTSIECIELKDSSSKNSDQKCKQDSQLLLEKIKNFQYRILCDEKGKLLNSVQLSQKLEALDLKALSDVVFIVGGPYGSSEELKSKADLILSLSPLTFTHDFSRVILLEQLYRAYTISRKENYHH